MTGVFTICSGQNETENGVRYKAGRPANGVESNRKDGSDIPPHRHAIALLRRVADCLENNEIIEAVGAPYDTYAEQH